VFVKKSYLSSWVFTAMQSVHIRMNSSLSTSLQKILDPPMAVSVAYAENFHGGGWFTQWHMVVICIWCAQFVTSQFDVIFMVPNQYFREIC